MDIIQKLLQWNKVYRAYRIFPAFIVCFSMYIVYKLVLQINPSKSSWDLGAVLGGLGILIERILSAYMKTGNIYNFKRYENKKNSAILSDNKNTPHNKD